MKKDKKKFEFSKLLIAQESVLIWIMSICFIVLAFIAVEKDFLGELPWLTALVSLPWAAYGVSQAFYYKKSAAENTKGGIKFETSMKDYIDTEEECEEEPIDEETLG